MKNLIKVEDSILCRADSDLAAKIAPVLQYQKTRWEEGQFKKIRKTDKAFFIHKRTGVFLTGLLPRVREFLDAKNIDYNIRSYEKRLEPTKKMFLKGIELRPDQKRLNLNCVEKQRGIILSPTRSGKTITALSFLSMFPKAKVLFLCNSLDILNQAHDEFIKFDFRNIAKLGKGEKKWIGRKIVISTIQTFSRMNPEDYCDYFDIVVVDEAHHCVGHWNSTKQYVHSQYGIVMCYLLAPVKIGFTATMPTDKRKILSIEGLLGPVIGEVTQQESVKLGITMKPKIELIPVPYSPNIGYNRRYADLYRLGIVENRIRNRLVVKEVKKRINSGKTVLVVVKEIQHGKNIQNMARDVFDIRTLFIRGTTESEIRNKVKKAFIEKKVKAVICTSVWREGVNIPTLDCVINAIGGKSDIMILQTVGRSLTKTPDKKIAEIVDFLDPYRFLAEHAILRLSIYKKNDWL